MTRHTIRLASFVGALGVGAVAAWSAPVVLEARHAPQDAQRPAVAGPGARGRGGPVAQEIAVVDQFDKDGDKRLNRAERDAAREWLAANAAASGRNRRGGGMGGGARPTGTPGASIAPADVKAYADRDFYDPATLRTVFLQFEHDDWEQELAAFNNTDVEVPATLTVDGRTYKDAGIRFRGASSFMMVPAGSKRSLNVTVDWVHDNQAVGGHRTLNLLNAHGDPTFLRTVLYLDIAREYIPAPKANFVRVAINGESWGVYVAAEQFNKDFVRSRFPTDAGARWKVPGSPNGRGGLEYLGDDIAPYKRLYDIKSRDDAASWEALVNLTRVLNTTPPDRLAAALDPMLDVDGVLKFLAVEAALVNNDGYWTRASDYSLYRDQAGRFHVIPHDANETFPVGGRIGGPGRGADPRAGQPAGTPPAGPPAVGAPPPTGPPAAGAPPAGAAQGGGRRGRGPGGMRGGTAELDPPVGLDDASKPLRSKLLAVPELRTRYLGYVRDIATRWLDWSTLGPRVEQYRRLIEADVKADTRKLDSFEAFERGIDELRAFVERRREVLLK